MPVVAATGKQRRKVRFPATSHAAQLERPLSKRTQTNLPTSRSSPLVAAPKHFPSPKQRGRMAEPHPAIPALFSEPPVVRDKLITETTEQQDETVKKCLEFLAGSHSSQKGPLNRHGVSPLLRDEHIGYLYDSLEDYPPGFVAMDASRPWMIYWALAGLSLLGEDVTKYRER